MSYEKPRDMDEYFGTMPDEEKSIWLELLRDVLAPDEG